MDEKRPPEKDEAPAQSARTHSGRPTATFLPIDMFAVCCDTKRFSVFVFEDTKYRISISLQFQEKETQYNCVYLASKKCAALF